MGIFSKRRSPDSMKRLYNWFFKYYHRIERHLDPMLDEVVAQKIRPLPGIDTMTAADFACGTGMLTLKLASLFKQVTGIDQSAGMLGRARARAESLGQSVRFVKGSLLDIQDQDASFDWVFVSFALHLFPPDTEAKILEDLLRISTQGVFIIDHPRTRSFMTALVERLEGSWYDQFIRTDFASIADRIGAASFEEDEIDDCMVLVFRKGV